MKTSESLQEYDDGAIIKEGRVFRPLYKHLLDNMPKDLVAEMARRQLESIAAHNPHGQKHPHRPQ